MSEIETLDRDARYNELVENSAHSLKTHITARPLDSFTLAVTPGEDFPTSYSLHTSGHSETGKRLIKKCISGDHSQSFANMAFFKASSELSDIRPLSFIKIDNGLAYVTVGAVKL